MKKFKQIIAVLTVLTMTVVFLPTSGFSVIALTEDSVESTQQSEEATKEEPAEKSEEPTEPAQPTEKNSEAKEEKASDKPSEENTKSSEKETTQPETRDTTEAEGTDDKNTEKKMLNTETVTDPEAAENLVYNGGQQCLIKEGTGTPVNTDNASASNEGKYRWVYAVDNKSDYSSTIPSKTNAGTYTVYYIKQKSTKHKFAITWYSWDDSEEGQLKVTIKPASISDVKIELEQSEFVYTGESVSPKISSVTDKNGVTLKTSDYEIVSGNTGKDKGNYQLIIRGKGNYDSGTTATKDWSISNKQQLKIKISSDTNLTYDGTKQGPAYTVTDADGESVDSSKYEIVGDDRATNKTSDAEKDTFRFSAKATDTDSYSDSTEVSWTMSKAELPVTVKENSWTYDGREHPLVTVEDNRTKAEASQVIPITYSEGWAGNLNWAGEKTIPNKKDVPATLTASGDYYLWYRINDPDDEGHNFNYKSKEKAQKKCTVSKAVITEDMLRVYIDDEPYEDPAQIAYDGNTHKAYVKAFFPGTDNELPESAYSSVTLREGPNAGKYNIYVTTLGGDGNFVASETGLNKKWEIVPRSIAEADITMDKTAFAFGETRTPAIESVTLDEGATILSKSDYEIVSGASGKQPGNYELTIRGKGNYDSNTTASVNWSISDKESEIYLKSTGEKELTFNGGSQTPEYAVVDGDGNDIPEEAYKVTGIEKTNAGSYTLTAEADPKHVKDGHTYTGTKSFSWTIKKAKAQATVKAVANLVYNGKKQPLVTGELDEVSSNDGVVIQYKEGLLGEWSNDIPERKDAALLYNVFYRTTGTDNCEATGELAPSYVPVTIAKADLYPEMLKVVIDGKICEGDSVVYDGQEHNVTVDAYIGETKLSADDFRITAVIPESTTRATNAGAYDVYVTTSVCSGNLEDRGDWFLNKKWAIDPKPVTAVLEGETRDYEEGNLSSAVTASAETGVADETMEITGLKGRFEDDTAGQDKPVTVDQSGKSISITGGQAKESNYDVTIPETTTGTINRIHQPEYPGAAVSMKDCTYGITAETPTLTGVLEEPEATFYYNKTGENTGGTEWKEVESHKIDAGDYYMYAEYEATNDYEGGKTEAVKFTVNKREITVKGITAKDKVYDGSTKAELDFSRIVFAPTTHGISFAETSEIPCNNDEIGVTGIGTFKDKNAGVGKTVMISELQLTGADKDNYQLDTSEGSGTQQETVINVAPKNAALYGSGITIEKIKKQIYSGKAVTPELTINDSAIGEVLVKNRDYTIKYSNNVKIGTAIATVTFTGNYSGIMAKEFKIVKAFGSTAVKGSKDTSGNGTSAAEDNGIFATGDDRMLVAAVELLLLSAAAIAAMLWRRHEKRCFRFKKTTRLFDGK